MNDSLIYSGNVFNKYIDNKKIVNKIKELSIEINNYYFEKSVHIVGLLDGCTPTLNELVKNLKISYKISTVKISSYKGMERGKVSIQDNIDNICFHSNNVLIVDDIIDSGNTIKNISKVFIEDKKIKDVKVFSLLIKKDVVNLCDWYSFIIPDKYVIGYGMDINNLFRDLKDIYILNE